MSGRILICTTTLTTVKAFLIPHIELLRNMGYSIDIAGRQDVEGLDDYVDKIFDVPFERRPFSRTNITAGRELRKIICRCGYDIIHFHTPIASAIGRWVARREILNGTRVFYTAHGFHFYKGAPLRNWLIYYPVERFLSRYTDVIITINEEDHARARKFQSKEVRYVPGVGIDINKYSNVPIQRTHIRKELGLPDGAFVILSVGELNRNKNHETVIRALARLNIPNLYYLICGEGKLKGYLVRLINTFNLNETVKLLGYRSDMGEIYRGADLFVFPSFREGLSVALMEAMASKVPIICSNIRGNRDLVSRGKGGLLIEPGDIDGLEKAIRYMMDTPGLRSRFAEQSYTKVKLFGREYVLEHMRDLYDENSLP